MDYDTISPKAFGPALRGIGVNLLCRDVSGTADFLARVFGLTVRRLSADFAIVLHDDMVLQLHSDAAFSGHPLHPLLPEAGPRGAGAQVYLFGCDPDAAAERADSAGGVLVEAPADKPHGLREATILSPEGYAFTAAAAVRAA